MIYLFLSIFCSTFIFLIFKSFEKYSINTFAAIVINYLVAAFTGIVSILEIPDLKVIVEASWLPNSILLGSFFIGLFYIMAITSQKLGPSVASIANKMALVIPVIFASFYYGDQMTLIKVIGIIIALLGIYLSAVKPKSIKRERNFKLLWIPLVLFLGSGFIDTFIKYNQEFHLKSDAVEGKLFSATTFLTAFLLGLVVLLVKKNKKTINKPTLWGGLLLGIINFGSIYFLIEIFNHSKLESSVVFPINNMGVVFLTSLSSFILFKEKFSPYNKVGILLSLLSILLISISI